MTFEEVLQLNATVCGTGAGIAVLVKLRPVTGAVLMIAEAVDGVNI
jgi:hypothetical protein